MLKIPNNRNLFSFCLLTFVFSLLVANILPQGKDKTTKWPEPVFEHLTIADGLPENSVRCILQDHIGYMWFGTQNGLVRYDGYNMKVYQPDPDDSLSISDRQIYAIYEDRSGTLWIGTERGLNRFERATETFKSYLHNSDDLTSINADIILSIYEDKTGNMLVGTTEGLNLFDKKTEHFKNIYYRGSVYSPDVYEYLSSLISRGKRISSILQVGNNADLKKTFTVSKKTIVLTVIMDEAGYDDGWLEDASGNIVAGENNNNLVYAGGHTNSLIQLEIDTLNKGSYRLRYVSDGGWSYNSWRDTPPDYPDFWGVQVIELPEDQGNVKEILNNIKTSALNYNAYAIMKDWSTGNLYVGSSCGIFIFNKENHSLVVDNRISGLGEVHSFLQSKDSSIWIGHSMGLTRFNSLDNSIKLYQPSPSITFSLENNFGQIIADYNGFIWGRSGTNKGLICFNPQNEQFKTYKYIPEKQTSLSSNNVGSIYQDRSGIMWVGTMWAGLNKWDRNKQKFKRYSFDPDNSDGERFNIVRSIIEDKEGLVWFGTNNGLYSFNRFTNKFRKYSYHSAGKDNSVTHIYIDESGIIWLGTLTKGLVKVNPRASSFQFYSKDPFDTTAISNDNVRFIFPDDNDILWIGTWGGGLNKFNKKTGDFARYVHDPSDPLSLSSNQITSIYEDRKEVLWIGTNGGELNKFDKINNTFKSYDLERFVTGTVTAIYEDQKRNFWIGTYHTGIYLFDSDAGIPVYNITEKDGLVNNQVESILEDDSGNLWIGTVNGISKFDPETNNIKNYYSSEGFDGNNYWNNSAYKTSTGEMLFGTYDGFIMFNPDIIKDDPVPPQVVISNVSLFNEPDKKLKFDGFISELKELNLSYNENDLRFDYVGLHYGDPAKNHYKYMLEGFDKDWVDAGTQRNATYTNLDAGEYIFRVTACNAAGVWNEEDASLKIIIPPPFWATWWAYSFYVLIGLVVLYSIRRYELNRTHLKNQHKLDEVKLKEREETDKMKSRFFANISHEFRTPLTLILGPSENIITEAPSENATKQAGAIKRNANRLLALINQLLDLSKLEAGKLELKASKYNIVSFIKGTTMSFESVAEGKDITLKVIPDREQIDLFFDKEKMTKIMTNLLSNAFKFTQKGGNITVSINEGDNAVRIKVKDTGQGIPEEELPKLFDRFYQVDSSQTREHEGTGIGLALTKELVELHRGTISVDSKLNEGTEFTIELPVGRSHLKDEVIVEAETESTVILNEVKNLTEFSITDSSSQAPQNDNTIDEDKDIVLVVEDNSDVREFIKDSLGTEFQIEEAQNGEQGVRKAEQIIPDLIISDIMMPKMDGNELTRTLKNNEKTSHIPIILLTAKSEQESRLEGLEIGADDYLTKPFDTKELQIRINNLISIRRKLQEKYSKGDFVPVKKAEERKLSNLEEQFMSKVLEVIEKHLSEEEFSIELFGKEVGMSRVQLHRKLKALSGKSASNYLRSVRLNKAKQMIEEQKGNISEIAYSVGFSSPQYFTRCFKEEFGIPPSELTI